MERINYSHVEPNSHFWTDLDMLIRTLEFDIDWYETKEQREERIKTADYPIVDMYEPLTPEFLIVGLENSLKNGYELKRVDKTKTIEGTIIFKDIHDIIHLIEDEGCDGFNKLLNILNNTLNNGYNLNNGIKMERTEVYKCLDTERDYQDLRWSTRRTLDGTPDEEKPPAEWINYMEHHISAAKKGVYELDTEEALAQVRKVAALAVRCLELHGCPERVIPEELLNEV